ncbi:MAG: 30S ribosomal protein S5 [Patescibacteria group bacterium]|nr:30S ribosomal protein S5 [Patescibacteria group bacterium]
MAEVQDKLNNTQPSPVDKRSARGKRGPRTERPVSEFDERVIEVSRVTRVVKGGKRLRFRTLVVIGNAKGKVGYGLGKAGDVSQAVQKAVANAKKDLRTIALKNSTVPYQVIGIYKSAKVLVKPAGEGSGLIAGGPVRIVLQLAGLKDAVAKMLGSKNKISNVMATIKALDAISSPENIKQRRLGKKSKTEKEV